nr:uncharacterized protein LOC124809458 [Hydra vulgaris]
MSTASDQQLSLQRLNLITNAPTTYLPLTRLYKQNNHKRLSWEVVLSLNIKHKKVSYFMHHRSSFKPKQYQFSPANKPSSRRKPGPTRQLFVKDKVPTREETLSFAHPHFTGDFVYVESIGGSISFVSKDYCGASSNCSITEGCNVARRFTPCFIALFDIGFNVQDLFLSRQVKAVIPPFLRSKRQCIPSEAYHCKRIACARIYIECVIEKLKKF